LIEFTITHLHRKAYLKLAKRIEKYNKKIGWMSFNTYNQLYNVYEKVTRNSKGHPFKVYYGEMRRGTDDIMEGRGILVYQNGETYIGTFAGNEPEGLVRIISMDINECYQGYMRAGQKHGQGTDYYESGKRFQGSWINGKRDGPGTFYEGDRIYETNQWKLGKKVSSTKTRG
jgi:hypothetical protein